MPPKANPLSKEDIFERCRDTIIIATDLRAITRNEDFINCSSRNEQLLFLREFLPKNCFILANTKLLAKIFNITEGNIRKILCNANKKKKPNGRPLKLSDEEEIHLLQVIISKKDSDEYMTLSQILRYAEETFKISLTRGWLNSFFTRHKNKIIKTIIYPQEDAKLKVPQRYLKENLDLVQNVIGITPAELIYNIDETGLSDWEERKPKMVAVPKELENR